MDIHFHILESCDIDYETKREIKYIMMRGIRSLKNSYCNPTSIVAPNNVNVKIILYE